MKRSKATKPAHLLRGLVRDLRYRALPELIGRTVELASLKSVESSLRQLLEPLLPPGAKWLVNSHLEGALAKYGLIDTSFVAPAALLDHPSTEAGGPVLRAHGFAPPAEERPADGDPFFEDPTCLEELADDLKEGVCVLKLFLEDGFTWETRMAQAKAGSSKAILGRLPADYFPRQMKVVDACVTNAAFVWFHTHFYM